MKRGEIWTVSGGKDYAGKPRPVVIVQEDGSIAVKPIMRVTLSADHRIIDGSVAAHFISDLKAALEKPNLSNL